MYDEKFKTNDVIVFIGDITQTDNFLYLSQCVDTDNITL